MRTNDSSADLRNNVQEESPRHLAAGGDAVTRDLYDSLFENDTKAVVWGQQAKAIQVAYQRLTYKNKYNFSFLSLVFSTSRLEILVEPPFLYGVNFPGNARL